MKIRLDIFLVYLYTRFQLPMVSGSDQKAKENFCMTVLLLFYSLQ